MSVVEPERPPMVGQFMPAASQKYPPVGFALLNSEICPQASKLTWVCWKSE